MYNRSTFNQSALNRNGQVVSSVIKDVVLISAATGTVVVQLVEGASYVYTDVPLGVIGSFLSASSLGQFWSRNIVGRYNEQRGNVIIVR